MRCRVPVSVTRDVARISMQVSDVAEGVYKHAFMSLAYHLK